MSSTVALFISLVYWIALHPYVVKYHMLGGAYAQFLNFFLHGFNSLSFLIDIFVTARPTRVHHFYFAIIFGKADRLKQFEVTQAILGNTSLVLTTKMTKEKIAGWRVNAL